MEVDAGRPSGRRRSMLVGNAGRSKINKLGGAIEQTSVASVVSEDMVLAERGAMIAQRQAEMEAVSDRHDSMVRELFHMDRFRIMTTYDPVLAKLDESPVFNEFKSKFDLVDNSTSSVGPSRSTRRAHNARRQTIQGTTHPMSAPLITPKGRTKVKDNTALWDILSSARKGKGKEKEKPITEKPSSRISLTPPGAAINKTILANGKHSPIDPTESISLHIKRKPPLRRQSSVPDTPTSLPTLLEPTDESTGISIKNQASENNVEVECTLDVADEPPAKKRRKTGPPIFGGMHEIHPNSGMNNRRRVTRHSLSSVTPSLPLEQPKRPTRSDKRPPMSTSRPKHAPLSSNEVEPPTPTSAIKRIKLIVRPPPLSISNPRQKPPPPRHNCSLQGYLNSFVILHDRDVPESALDKAARTDAAVLERAETLKKEGRFVPGAELLFGDPPDLTANNTPPRTSTDIWDAIISAAAAACKARPKKPIGVQIAGQIANKIQAYWDGHTARQDKAKALEEKKLRALAKATIKAVVNEWKKAVYHIREQERLRLEAEELKRGHEHLDAILNQSGQILEAQHGDLSRGDMPGSRSRSGSLPLSLGWPSDTDDDDDEDEDGSVIADASEDEDVEGEANDNASELGLVDAATPEEGQGSASGELVKGGGEAGVSASAEASDHDDQSSDEDDGLGARALLADDYSSRPDTEANTPQDMLSDPAAMCDSPEAEVAESPAMEIDTPHDDSQQSTPSVAEPALVVAVDDDTRMQAITGVPCSEPEASAEPPIPPLNEHSPKSISANNLHDDHCPSADLAIQPETPEQTDNALTDVQINSPSLLTEPHTSCPKAPVDVKTNEVVDPSTNANLPSPTPHPIESTTPVDPEHEADAPEEPTDVPVEVDIPEYLKPYAVAPVNWDPQQKVKPPILLRGILRPYQHAGLEWLASLHVNNLNGILADEMGLGKTIQTISLLAHLACDRGIWGPHLIIVPTSVLLNWEMEFKKFLPGFKVLSYHGNTKRRKELRQGWNDKFHFNVCITSYTLASRDAHIFKRKPWYYMILDEAHMIKNFKSQRWNILLMFRSFRRLLLTGTPLQNNLTELWALLQFLMSGGNFANLKEFGEWFSNPLEKAIEMGNALDDETLQRVSKLHTVLRPYLLRRLKRDVEKELPSKYEHLVLCPLSKRQRFLYDEFMARAQTRDALDSGVYQKIANILMQLRKVCNHPDLFEIRPIVTSFAMDRSAIADFEIKELLVRRHMLQVDEEQVNLDVLGLRFVDQHRISIFAASETKRLDATSRLPFISEIPGEPPPKDYRTIAGFKAYSAYQRRVSTTARWAQIGYLNRLRCQSLPVYSEELLRTASGFSNPLVPLAHVDRRFRYMETTWLAHSAVKTYTARAGDMSDIVAKFAFATPAVVARDMPRLALPGLDPHSMPLPPDCDEILHPASVKLQIAFPDSSLLQYDCGKLQELTRLLREKKAGGHRVLIFTQMTKVLDILEIFLNLHGYLYLRLDGATKIEDRQYITERFNVDARIFCFIASSRSGGVGINLTGADTVIFYDSDFNPQMDRQCEDRAHRIGQIRDVHIYRFVSQHTVEEALLRKANQKRSLDDIVIQKGEFDWRTLFTDESALTQALGEFEDTEDAHAAAVAAREEVVMEGADEADFGGDAEVEPGHDAKRSAEPEDKADMHEPVHVEEDHEEEPEEEDGGTVVDYMLSFVKADYDFFREWRI